MPGKQFGFGSEAGEVAGPSSAGRVARGDGLGGVGVRGVWRGPGPGVAVVP